MARLKKITVAPAVTAGAYAANDAVGGQMEFAQAASAYRSYGTIKRIIITDMSCQDMECDVFIYKSAPTVIADNAPFDPADADMLLLVGVIEIAAADWVTGLDNQGVNKDVDLEFVLDSLDTSLFAQIRVVDTPTFAAVDDISVTLVIER